MNGISKKEVLVAMVATSMVAFAITWLLTGEKPQRAPKRRNHKRQTEAVS